MARDGKAKVLTNKEFDALLAQIGQHRHPEKNTLIAQLSFKLGLRVQEMSLLRIREVATLSPEFVGGYQIKDVLVLPKGFTKGARALAKASKQTYQRKSVRFSLDQFDNVIQSIVAATKADLPINPKDYYPAIKPKGGKTRELPLVDPDLISAIEVYLDLRQQFSPLKPNKPLLLSQKGGAYSPNTLQDHMRMMMREWTNLDRASSHSGRRTLATKLLHDQHEHLKTVQQILGHKDAATTTIYHELPESEVRNVLNKASKTYKK